MAYQCPLCGSTTSTSVASVALSAIANAYALPPYEINIEPYCPTPSDELRLHRCSRCDLGWFTGVRGGDGPFYEKLQRIPWYYVAEKAEFAFARSLIRPDARVVEIGSGAGAFATSLPRSVRYTGLEFNDQAIRDAQSKGLDVRKIDATDYALEAPESADVVVSFQVLEHVTDPKAFLEACARLVKPTGQLIIAVPAEDSFVGQAFDSIMNMPPHHLTRWSDKALKFGVERVGFAVKSIWHEPVSDIHRDWQRNVAVRSFLRATLGKTPSLGRTVLDRLADRACRAPLIGDFLFRRAISKLPFMERGHTVCIAAVKGVAF
jgi:SAM-dependent methyltransferase